MFESFTEKAIKVVMLGHNSVGTGQLLLGLIASATGVAEAEGSEVQFLKTYPDLIDQAHFLYGC